MKTTKLERLLMDASSPGIKPGLARLSALCQALGHPERSFQAVHVAGTNGKGSTAAYLSQIFEEAGYPCALYTSPHLEDLSERCLFRGTPLPFEAWEQGVKAVLAALGNSSSLKADPPTFFELLTAAVFQMIRELGVPFVILETGMGGRLDATNIVPTENVLLSVITAIGMDHADYLGDSLEAIAAEKFAIVRPGRPALFMGDPPSLVSRFRSACKETGAEPHVLMQEWESSISCLDLNGGNFTLSGPSSRMNVQTPLLGRHQITNASLAAAACQLLRPRMEGLTERAIIEGIGKTRWPGRLELIPGEPPVLLDGGHNAHGVEHVVSSLGEIMGEGAEIGLVYATMADKDYSESLGLLRQLSDRIFCTAIPGNARCLPAADLAEAARKAGFFSVTEEADPLQALQLARAGGHPVLCLGSLYLVGWLRARIL